MVRRTLLQALLVIVVVVGCVSWGMKICDESDKVYEGKVLFATEQEYSQFKNAIGQEDITLVDALVLSSSPPIVVKFRAYVPGGKEFGYGEDRGRRDIGVAPLLVGSGVLLIGSLLIWTGRKEEENPIDES